MASKKTTISLAPVESEKVEGLVAEGKLTSKGDVFRTYFRIILGEKPEYKIDVAVYLYKTGRISIGRAVEISRLGGEEFDEVLGRRGVKKPIDKKRDEEEKITELRGILSDTNRNI